MNDRLEVLLKEYETLRQESLDSINNRSQIVSFGLGTTVLLAGSMLAGIKANEADSLLVLVFSGAVPIISVLVLYVWLGEVERMMRAGRYLVDLETRINAELGAHAPTLTWETWLRTRKTQMQYPYIVVMGLFTSIGLGAPLIGYFAVGASLNDYFQWLAAPWIFVLTALLPIGIKVLSFR